MKFTRRRPSAPVPRRRQTDDSFQMNDLQNRSYLRNRTISAVTPIDESSRGQAHSLTTRRRRLGSIFLVVLAVIVALTLLVAQLTAQVTVGVSGTQLSQPPDETAYAKSISTYLNTNPVERLRFALSETQLMEYMQTVHPEVASIKQQTTWGIGATNFVITFRQPVAGWQINGQQYYVDSNGVAFQKNYYAPPTVQIIDQTNGTNNPTGGTTVASSQFLSFIGKVVSLAKGRGYTVTQAILPPGTSREVAIHLAGISSEVRMTVDRGAGEQVEDMDRALKYFSSHGASPQYIDVRIAQRAYYQ